MRWAFSFREARGGQPQANSRLLSPNPPDFGHCPRQKPSVAVSRFYVMGRHGLTIIELVAVVAVIGMLMALMLTAVQAAREAARRHQCLANLQQIGVAIAQYEAFFRSFPAGSDYHGLSVHTAMLPFIEQEALYGRIDRATEGTKTAALKPVSLSLFLCPSDAGPRQIKFAGEPYAGTNYAGSCGTWPLGFGFDGAFGYWRGWGPFIGGKPLRAAGVTDGLSNVFAFSEILRADGTFARLRVNWSTPQSFGHRTEVDAFARYCGSIPSSPTSHGWLGDPWMRGTPWTSGCVAVTLYDHVLGPNQPSCYNGTEVTAAAATAASAHPNGVNCLFLDGHLEFVADSISIDVWREKGTRSTSPD